MGLNPKLLMFEGWLDLFRTAYGDLNSPETYFTLDPALGSGIRICSIRIEIQGVRWQQPHLKNRPFFTVW